MIRNTKMPEGKTVYIGATTNQPPTKIPIIYSLIEENRDSGKKRKIKKMLT